MEHFKLNRKSLSALYISVLISFFVLQLLNPFFQTWTSSLAVSASGWLKTDLQTQGKIWLVFISLAIIIALLIRQFVVLPLGFNIDSDEGGGWGGVILLLIILGFYIYMLNQIFSYSMPLNAWWMPSWLIRFLGGYRNTFLPLIPRSEYKETWPIDWFWYLAPITFMYVRTKIVVK